MTFDSIASETTIYMTVKHDDGRKKEYTRTAYGEWCETISYNSLDDLARVDANLATRLENLRLRYEQTKREVLQPKLTYEL